MSRTVKFSLRKTVNSIIKDILHLLELIGHPILFVIKFIINIVLYVIQTISNKFEVIKNDSKKLRKRVIFLLDKKRVSFQRIIKKIALKKDNFFFVIKSKRKSFLKFLKKFKKKLPHKKFVLPTFPKIKFSFPKIKLPKVDLHLPKIKRKKIVLFSLLGFFGLITIILIVNFFNSLPSPETLRTRNTILTTKIYDRNNTLLYKIYKNQNRTLIKLNDLPKNLINATIAIEDRDFYNHRGFSIKGIIRALRQNFFYHERLEGGSTITQQLVKNTLLTPERTVTRKIKEVILALEIESDFTKEEILTMYFNEVGYGSTSYGIAEASEMYFGKKPKDLTLGESAFLAGLTGAPTYYSPFGVDPQRGIDRQYEVLRRMVEDGYVTEAQSSKIKNQKLVFAPQRVDIKAPHFVMYVKDLLVQKYGEKMVEQGGLSVKTSLDLKTQEMVEKEVANGVKAQEYLLVGNGAALVTNPGTGEILAMVGSKDYFDLKNDGNVNVCLMERQPGSSIKPLNYAIALEKGMTPATVIQDSPVAFEIPGQPVYAPQNYDGRFHGTVTLRQSLGNSYNIPAVKVLSSYGVSEMIKRAKDFGITTWADPARYGLSLTLGGGEVKMTDMATAFGVFANKGTRIDLNPILEVTDSHDQILDKSDPSSADYSGNQVLSDGVSFLISNILADNFARSATFGPNSPLVIPNHTVSVKTGTTDTKRDNWTIGYTSSFLTAVWIGNNNNQPMSMYLESGYTGAAPIWHNIMTNLLKDKKDEPLIKPDSVSEVQICRLNGLLPCDNCPTITEYFVNGTEPKNHCRSEDLKPTPSPDNK